MFGPLSATVTLTTGAPPLSVWTAFATAARWPEVLPDLASARIDPDGKLVPGAVIRTIALPSRNVIDMSYEVLAAEPERGLVLQSSAEGFSAQTTYAFAPSENPEFPHGTNVTVTAVITPGRLRRRITAALWRPKLIEQIELSVRRRTSALIELAEKISSETQPTA